MGTLPLLSDSLLPDSPRLIGIARLAADGESLREGHEVEYFTLPTRSLLNRCTSTRVPFTWTINPYRGCEFACKYCYARYTHEFMELRDGAEFEQKIFVKEHAADLLRQELRQVRPGEDVAIGTATDPYQPAERRYEVTRAILEELSRHQGLRLSIITKSNLILRDIELLSSVARCNELRVHVTITTLNAELARLLEPRAPRPDLRLAAVRKLSQAGLRVGVSCSPVLPGISDAEQDLDRLIGAAAEAGARHVFANALFLKPCSAAVFFPFLREKFPHLVKLYQQQFGDKAFVPRAYAEKLALLMASLRQKHGLAGRSGRNRAEMHTPHAAESQLTLF
jgi:DNA repair photolyase